MDEDIRAELRAIALARPVDCLRITDGVLELLPLGELPAAGAAGIASVELGPHGVKVRFYDKLKAIELLCSEEGAAAPENNLLEVILAALQNEEVLEDEDGVSFEE